MSNRAGALLAVLISLAAAVLFAGCAQSREPRPSQSPSSSPSSSEALPLGQSAIVDGFEMTPAAVRPRSGPVYDAGGKPIKGHGINVMIKVAKHREADFSGADSESTVPVARVVDSEGRMVKMDDYLGMVPYSAQSTGYGRLYADSYQYACVQPPGTGTTAALWFSIPKGFVPEKLVIDEGAGQESAWLLP